MMVNNAYVEPAVKERIEIFLNRAGVAFNDFLNGLELKYDEDNPPPFVVRSKEELMEKLEEAERDFEEGRFYTAEEVEEMFLRKYGI